MAFIQKVKEQAKKLVLAGTVKKEDVNAILTDADFAEIDTMFAKKEEVKQLVKRAEVPKPVVNTSVAPVIQKPVSVVQKAVQNSGYPTVDIILQAMYEVLRRAGLVIVKDYDPKAGVTESNKISTVAIRKYPFKERTDGKRSVYRATEVKLIKVGLPDGRFGHVYFRIYHPSLDSAYFTAGVALDSKEKLISQNNYVREVKTNNDLLVTINGILNDLRATK